MNEGGRNSKRNQTDFSYRGVGLSHVHMFILFFGLGCPGVIRNHFSVTYDKAQNSYGKYDAETVATITCDTQYKIITDGNQINDLQMAIRTAIATCQSSGE